MPDYEVRHGLPMKTYPVQARDMLSAGWVFAHNLPAGAKPGYPVQFVSIAGHDAWFPWEGLMRDKERVERATVTYQAKGELHTVTLNVRASGQEMATKILRDGCKTIKSIEFPDPPRDMSEENEEAIESFVDAWNSNRW